MIFPNSASFPNIASFPGPDPDTTNFKNRIIANNGTISNTSLEAVDIFIKGCKADNIWDLLLDVGLFVGDNLAAALTKLKYPLNKSVYTNINYVNGDYSQSTGIQGGVNKYLDSGVSPQDVGTTGGFVFYLREATGEGTTKWFMGATNTGGTNNFLLGHGSGGSREQFYWGQNVLVESIQQNTSGFFVGMRNNLSSLKIYKKQTLLNINPAVVSFAPIAQAIYIAAVNLSGTAVNFLDKKYSFTAITKALNDAQVFLFYSRVQALQESLGRAI